MGAEAGGREYVHIRQGQGKGRRRQVRDRDRPGRGRTKESIHVRCGAPTHAPKCTPERKEAFLLHSDDSSQRPSLIVTIIADTPITSLSLSLPACRISRPACFSQVNNNPSMSVTSQASAMTPRLPPLPLPTPKSAQVPVPSHARQHNAASSSSYVAAPLP